MNTSSQLFELAYKVYQQAYAPYSKFAVGAAILSSDGRTYSGCNVENISYPCGSCAEQGAISAMIAGGSKEIAQILVLADSQDLITPCGACLQRIQEFATPECEVLLADLSGIKQVLKLQDLLPHAFQNQELCHE